MASVTHLKVSAAAAASDPALVGGPDWNAGHHVLDLSTIAGTNGGAAAAGGSIVISGGTGDDGNDPGASVTVGGGSGDGSAGRITVTGVIQGDASSPPSIALTDDLTLTGAEGGTGEAGGDVSVTAGRGNALTGAAAVFALRGNADDGTGGDFEANAGDGEAGKAGGFASLSGGTGDDDNDAAASVTVYGGSGGGAAGTISITTGGLTFSVIGGTASPSAGGGVAADVASLYARDNSGTGELWVKTGTTDTAWTKVV